MINLDSHICICKGCLKGSDNSVFTAKGKKTEFILKNIDRIKVDKYIVDDCLLKSRKEEEKCDYLFDLKTKKIVYLIECKGSNILKAVDQLNSSFELLKHNFLGYNFKGRIVSTKVFSPNMRSRSYSNLRSKFNGNLETKNISCTEIIK